MKYMDYLQKYQDLGQRDWKDFKEILDEIDKVKLERVENPTLNAVVVLGYSGNGKTTAIKNFILNHPEYKIISIDEICKSFINQNNKYPNIYELQSLFGKELEKSVINKENIILDGNFLNILNRMALSDYLHSNDYNINSLNLTPMISKTLPLRIEDETTKILNKNFQGNRLFYDYANMLATKNIMSFYSLERKRASMIEQEIYKSLNFGIDKEFYLDNIKDLNVIPKELKKQ